MNYKTGIGAVPIIIVIGILVVGGFFFFSGKDVEAPEETEETTDVMEEEENTSTDSQMEDDEITTQEVIVKYTNEGFTPQKIEVPIGTTVTFVNESGNKMWVATNVHPSHTVYPGSGISKCGTAGQSLIFDQCESTENGGSYSFTFTEVGEWGYHNHSLSKDGGTVVVK